MLEDEPDPGAKLSWRLLTRVQARHDDSSDEVATGAVGDQAVKASQERRLATARGPAHQNHLTRLDGRADVVEGGRIRLRVSVRQAINRDQCHGSGAQARSAPQA